MPENCKRCGEKIQPVRVTGPPGGRVVQGGWYGVKDDPGPYCPACVQIKVIEGLDA